MPQNKNSPIARFCARDIGFAKEGQDGPEVPFKIINIRLHSVFKTYIADSISMITGVRYDGVAISAFMTKREYFTRKIVK